MIKKNIGELLLEYGMITQDDIEEALVIQRDQGVRIGEALIQMEKVSEYDIEYILSVQLNIPYVLIDDLVLDGKLIRRFPDDFLMSNRILPVYETDTDVSIVTDDPFNTEAFGQIEAISGKKIQLSCGSGSKISKKLNDFLCQSEGIALVSELEKLIEKIKGTSFFRIDFNLRETECDIYIYGCGLLEEVKRIETQVTVDDIFNSFDLLKIPFYYSIPRGNDERFVAILPVDNDEKPSYPMSVSKYGLIKVQSLHFSDLKSHNIPNALYSKVPVNGYPFFSFIKQVDYELGITICDQYKKH